VDLIIISSQSAWIAYTLYSRANTCQLGPATIQAGAHLVAFVVLAPLALFEHPWESLRHASWTGWAVIGYCAGPITLGHLWYHQGVRAIGAGRAAVVMNLIPFLVIGLSRALLGESIRWYHGVGACVLIAGVALVTRRGGPITPGGRGRGAGAARRPYRLAAGLAGLAGLVLSPSLMRPLTSSMNWEMSLNWR
jgi:drug/metabolite transporter (DMT)-like permease